MEENDGLILGIDLQDSAAQVSVYNEKLNTSQAVTDETGTVFIPNLIKLSESIICDESGEHMDKLVSMLASLIEYGKKFAGRIKIAHICITIEKFSSDYLDCITTAMNRLQYSKGEFEIISRAEAFIYYAYSQKKELYSAGTVLLDFNERGLETYRMSCERKNNLDYIHEERKDFNTDDLISVGKGEAAIDTVNESMCGIITQLMEKRTASSVYLTGKGFDCEKLPDSLTKVICNRRKAFAGQNLYVKGACFCAKEKCKPVIFDNIYFDCEERIPCGIETDIMDRGQAKRFRIVRPGTNWFMAERNMDFILEDEREIVFYITSPDKPERKETVDISEIPFRVGKTTRIGVNVSFMAADRCVITIKDKGFGQFVKSSGKAFYLELDFNRLE